MTDAVANTAAFAPIAAIRSAWRDRAGRFSAIRALAFVVVIGPGLWLAAALGSGLAGAEPTEYALDLTGVWTIRLLLLSLLITPLCRALRWHRPIKARRMLGLGALSYALLHLSAHIADQGFDLVKAFSEIALRFYLAIGFVALFGLILLGVTSTDRWIRRLGANWRRLHGVVYLITALGLWHFLLQSKLDAAEATLMAGLFALLMGYRVLTARGVTLSPLVLAAAALTAVPLTMAFEVFWYAVATSLPPERVWAANLAFPAVWRPAWLVGAAGLAFALLAILKRGWEARGRLFRKDVRP